MNRAGYDIFVHVPTRFKLDGGAMFGSVPKVLWSKAIAADDQNRIPLACRMLILRNQERTVLIDLGAGCTWSEKQRQIYAFEYVQAAETRIEGVTDIILTHLHFDHAGGVSYYDAAGQPALCYPDATYYLQRANWERAQAPGPRERATYLRENIEPLRQARLVLTEGGQEILPGVTVHRADGHTSGLQWVRIGEGEGAVAFPSDLMPTAHHVALPYVMGYDLCAERTLEEKASFAAQAVSERWVVVFGHDAHNDAAEITIDANGRYCVQRVIELPRYGI